MPKSNCGTLWLIANIPVKLITTLTGLVKLDIPHCWKPKTRQPMTHISHQSHGMENWKSGTPISKLEIPSNHIMDKSTPSQFLQMPNIWPLEEKTKCYTSGTSLILKNQSEASTLKVKSIKSFSIKDYNGYQSPLNQELKFTISWTTMTNHMPTLTSSKKKTRTKKENLKERNQLPYL